MRIENEILDRIKKSTDIKPREEFIHQTKLNLIKEARRYNQRQKVIRRSYYWSGFVAALVMVTWIAFFGGTQYITNSFGQVMASLTKANKESSPVIENNKESKPISNDDPSVFIYHTHNTESFTTLLKIKDPMYAIDSEKNITLVGKKLDDFLQEKNIKSLHNKSDIEKIIKSKGWNYAKSYEVAREIIKKTLDENKDIKLIMDIHRDTQYKDITTSDVKGKEVARIAFVVAQESSKFEDNIRIAELIHEKLDKQYPGVSRGIIINEPIKDKNYNNYNYNQDLFGNSLLVEIGGVENTLEEEYRSVEILSEVINDILDEIE